MLRAALYCRVSPDWTGEREEDSLQRQEALGRAHCAQRGHSVVAVFTDTHTGAEMFECEGLRGARALASRGGYDVLVPTCVDRFGRQAIQQMIVIYELKQAGVTVEFVQDQIPDTPEGAIIHHVLAYGAQKERERILDRTYRARLERVTRLGAPMANGKAPYGYRFAGARKETLAEVPEEARWVRWIYARCLAGAALKAIARELNAQGVPSPSSRSESWAVSTVRNILHSSTYRGEYRALRYSVDKEPVLLAVPALVDAQSWALVQERLTLSQQHARRNNSDPEATLLRCGFVRCGSCGYRMSAQYVRAAGKWSYTCPNRSTTPCPQRAAITAAGLDQAVWERLQELVLNPRTIETALEHLLGNDPTAQQLQSITHLLAQVERRQRNYVARIGELDDPEVAAPLLAELKTLKAQKDGLLDEQAKLQAQRAGWERAREGLEEVYAWCETAAQHLATFRYEERRRLLRMFACQVTVWPAGHDPRYEIVLGPQMGDEEIMSRTTTNLVHNLRLRWVV